MVLVMLGVLVAIPLGATISLSIIEGDGVGGGRPPSTNDIAEAIDEFETKLFALAKEKTGLNVDDDRTKKLVSNIFSYK